MKEKWYLQTWFICLLFAAWPSIIAPIIGLILLIIQAKRRRDLEAWRTKKYGRYDEIDNSIQKLEHDRDYMQRSYQGQVNQFDAEIRQRTERISKLKQQESAVMNEIVVKQYDYSDYDGLSSEECRSQLSLLKMREKDNIRNGNYVIISSQDAKKRSNDNVKQILRCFNCECDNILLALSVKSVDSCRKKIITSYESLNKLFSSDGIQLKKEILEDKLDELSLVYTYELKKEEDRQRQREIKEQLLEDERARKEIERQKQKLEKDQQQCNNEINKLMKYLQAAQGDIEKQLYADKIQQLEERKEELEKEKETVMEREANARAGYVYVISNIGSFGEGVYKIGMTRRLEPMDRIKELGSASVPFEFDVHAMIFSEDAPALETALHRAFEKQSVNRINLRKEFFRVSLDEIEKTVKENFNNTVTFTRVPVAREYNATLDILKSEASL